MAKQGAPHETMVEAFTKRLRQLHPEPPAHYSFGSKVESVGLKPDIYVQHPDSRQWAFEMVHGNSSARHLLDNHRRYANHGIHDIWILWDSLRPKVGPDRPLEQGIMPALLPDAKVYPLTAPQRAILEMQIGATRRLYSFTVDPLLSSPDTSGLLQTLMIGLDFYTFEGWDGREHYPAEYQFVSLADLTFNEDGSPALPEISKDTEAVMRLALQKLGLNLDEAIIPRSMLSQFDQAVASAEGWRVLASASLVNRLIALPPEEIQEVMSFLQSGAVAQTPPVKSELTEADVSRAMDDPALMKRIAEESRLAKEHIASLSIPAPLKKLLIESIEDEGVAHMAEMMQWQASSDALRQAREKS